MKEPNAPTGRSVPGAGEAEKASGRGGAREEDGAAALASARRRIGVLTNPRSGGNRRGLQAVHEVLRRVPGCLHREATAPTEVADALEAFARDGASLLVLNGGDGTIQAALTALVHRRPFAEIPVLAVPRSGTGSLTARDVGLRGSRDAGLRRLASWARGEAGPGRLLVRPVLDVEDRAAGEPRCGMFFGVGAIYQGIQYYHRRLHTAGLRGEVGPGVALVRLLLEVLRGNRAYLPPVRVEAVLDGVGRPAEDCVFVLASALERLFLGLRPYFGRRGGGRLHYVAMRASPRHLLRVLPWLTRGRPHPLGTPENGYFSQDAGEIRLEFEGGFTIDGELYSHRAEDGPLTIRDAGPVRFLQV